MQRHGCSLAALFGMQIVLIEEAAEVMETHILASLAPYTEHLILIGDHEQLRPKAQLWEMQVRLNISETSDLPLPQASPALEVLEVNSIPSIVTTDTLKHLRINLDMLAPKYCVCCNLHCISVAHALNHLRSVHQFCISSVMHVDTLGFLLIQHSQ